MAKSRRSFLTEVAATGVALGWARAAGADLIGAGAEPSSASVPAPPAPAAPWPSQAPELAREMVGVSHGNVARVRELLRLHPTLANAAWDWGFGDWETALGAASHIGQREIAGLLLENGARPTLFSAAMLGQLEVVRALVAAAPGVQKTLGPHGLTLLHHARAGGEGALAVARYLEALGDADLKLEPEPLEAEREAALLGTYRFGPGESERIEIAKGRSGLTFERAGGTARPLHHRGELAFSPAGAERVRIRFTLDAGRAVALSVHDPELVLAATRV